MADRDIARSLDRLGYCIGSIAFRIDRRRRRDEA
jgi:hypothetical protein